MTNRARGGALAAEGTRKVFPDGEATGAIPLPVKDSWSCGDGTRDGRRRGCSARGKRRWAVAGGTVLRRGGRGLLGLGKLECIECAGYTGSTHSVLTVAAGKGGDKIIQRVFQDREQVKVGRRRRADQEKDLRGAGLQRTRRKTSGAQVSSSAWLDAREAREAFRELDTFWISSAMKRAALSFALLESKRSDEKEATSFSMVTRSKNERASGRRLASSVMLVSVRV